MADPVQPVAPVTPSTAVPSPAVAPEPVASPVAAPESASTVPVTAPAPVAETPTVAPTPVTETPPVAVAPKVETPVEQTSILSEAKPKEEIKVEPKAVEAKPEVKPEAKVEEKPVAAPTYDLKVPEGITLDPERLGAFTKTLAEFESGPKDHASAQAFAQKLIDTHLDAIKNLNQVHLQQQQEAWTNTRKGWVTELKADPEIGGKNFDSTVETCGAVMAQYGNEVGADRLGSLKMAMRITGMGDHPEMVRFVNWASKFAVEKSKPVAAPPARSPIPMTRSSRRYAGTQS